MLFSWMGIAASEIGAAGGDSLFVAVELPRPVCAPDGGIDCFLSDINHAQVWILRFLLMLEDIDQKPGHLRLPRR